MDIAIALLTIGALLILVGIGHSLLMSTALAPDIEYVSADACKTLQVEDNKRTALIVGIGTLALFSGIASILFLSL